VGIVEHPKVGKQSRDDSIKQFSIQPPYIGVFIVQLWIKDPSRRVILTCMQQSMISEAGKSFSKAGEEF